MAKIKTNLDPWERQKSESSKAYAAFCAYRDMGPDRSLLKAVYILYEDLGAVKPSSKQRRFMEWSSKYNWVARVEAYDVYLEAKKRHDNEKAIDDMNKRHTKVSRLAMEKSIETIELIGKGEIDKLTPKEALEYLKESVKIERLSRGVSTEAIEHSGNVGISRIEITTSEREDEEDKSKV